MSRGARPVLAPPAELTADFKRAAAQSGGLSALAQRLGLGRHIAEAIVGGRAIVRSNLFLAALSLDAYAKQGSGQALGHAERVESAIAEADGDGADFGLADRTFLRRIVNGAWANNGGIDRAAQIVTGGFE